MNVEIQDFPWNCHGLPWRGVGHGAGSTEDGGDETEEVVLAVCALEAFFRCCSSLLYHSGPRLPSLSKPA